MRRFTVPKVAVILATLASFAWIVVLYVTRSVDGPRAALVLAIPVAVSLWGWSSERFRKLAGVALLVFSLAILLASVWMIALSYVPSAILFLVGRRAEVAPARPL
jgi:hypothetical protein